MTTPHCPVCWIELPLSGEANCDCDGGTVLAAPVAQQAPARTHARPRPSQTVLDRSNQAPATPPPDLAPPAERTTVARLHELPDLAAHLALRLTSSQPGTETGGKRDPAETAPVHLAILHALDDRHRYAGDNMPAYMEDEAWRCPHAAHPPRECPWEADDDGRQGLLPDLALWARMINDDLEQYDPELPEDLPEEFTVASVCDWLARHHRRWATLDDGASDQRLSAEVAEQLRRARADMDNDVKRWHNRLRSELGERDPITLRHSTAGGCGHIIEPRDGGTWYGCTGCGEVFDHAAGLKRLAELQAPPTLTEASALTGIPLITLKRRVTDGELTAVNPGRRPARYRLRDVQQAGARRASRAVGGDPG